jgi:CheY-like chemotaxis protein
VLLGDPELADGDYLLLSVSDTGVGMPEDVRARAFDPFFTTKGVGKGTGLGLSQVYGIAKQAGGAARIESDAATGTTVTVYLPQAGQAAAVQVRSHDDAPVVAGARILIVDDDEGVRSYVAEALDHLGYACLQAADGPSGLQMLQAEAVDLLILDYAMPGMTGAEVAGAALRQLPDLPILFTSGYAESAALEAAVGRPAQLLRKPFDTETLARRVHEVITGKRATLVGRGTTLPRG